MKAYIIVIMVCAFASFNVAKGQISINWLDNSGITQSDGTTPLLGADGTGTAYGQLIYSPSGVISDATPGGPSGDNVVWDSSEITNTGGGGGQFAAGFSFQFNAPTFEAGQVFIRVFESTAINTPGTWYYDGVLETVLDDPASPQQVRLGPLSTGSGDFGTWQLDQQVIPEPSVFAMLGLGGLFLMIRRRFINK